MRVILRLSAPILASILCIAWTGGCYLAPSDPAGWRYVYEKAGHSPEQVTAWTLRQDEWRRIEDGQRTLVDIATEPAPDQSEQAMHGFVRVHEKALAGWKGLSKDPNLPEAIDVILAKDYALLAWAIRLTPERTALRRAMVRIKPPPDEKARLAVWRKELVLQGLSDELGESEMR